MECAQVVGESGAVTVICSAFRHYGVRASGRRERGCNRDLQRIPEPLEEYRYRK